MKKKKLSRKNGLKLNQDKISELREHFENFMAFITSEFIDAGILEVTVKNGKRFVSYSEEGKKLVQALENERFMSSEIH